MRCVIPQGVPRNSFKPIPRKLFFEKTGRKTSRNSAQRRRKFHQAIASVPLVAPSNRRRTPPRSPQIPIGRLSMSKRIALFKIIKCLDAAGLWCVGPDLPPCCAPVSSQEKTVMVGGAASSVEEHHPRNGPSQFQGSHHALVAR